MVVKLNFLVVVTLTLSLRQVLLRPSVKDARRSKTLSDIVDKYYDNVILPRIKKAVVVYNKCPKGMSFYDGQCMTKEEYEQSRDQVYDDVTNETSTQDNKRVTTVTVPADFSSTSELNVLDVNKLSRNNMKLKFNTNITVPRPDERVNSTADAKSESKATVNNTSNTDKIYNNKTVATTVAKAGGEDSLTWRKFKKLMTTVVGVCTWAMILVWLPKILYQKYLKRHEDERGSDQLLPPAAAIPTSVESSLSTLILPS